MAGLIIGAIVIIAIIIFINQSNEEKRKIEADRLLKIKQQDDERKRIELANRLERERLNKIEQQKRQEEEKRAELIRLQKAEEKRKLDEVNRLEKIRLQKIEDEKYETVFVVSTSILADGRNQSFLKRNDNTYADVTSQNPLTANSSLRQTKETIANLKWISASEYNKNQEQKEEQRKLSEEAAKRAIFEKIKSERIALQEKQSAYSNVVNTLMKPVPNFWKIYEHNISLTAHLHYTAIFDSLSSGTVIIEDPQTLINYMASYGGHHFQKLQTSYNSLFSLLKDNSQIEIIDYGCGQALATNVLYDFMLQNNKNLHVNKVTLIEPSLLALNRGILHLNYFIDHKNQQTKIININKPLDEITENDLKTSEGNIKIHLMSNIIDVVGFDYISLSNKIKKSQKGVNIFICVSPFNGTAQSRIIGFQNCFINQNINCVSEIIYKKAFDVMSRKWNDNYRITMFQRIFQSNL
jgi:hypothetical protein